VSALTCGVSGANGFLGQAVCRGFQSLGWKVIALVRRPQSAPEGCEPRTFVLGELPPPDLLAGVDVLVHAAYDFSMRSWADICRVNAVGSEYLFDAAARAGVKRQIFISSMAAFEGCCSKYGLGKLAAEHAARVRGGVVARPGLIYGDRNGGLAAQIAALAKKMPLVPMIGNGRYPLYTCHVEDLCALLLFLATVERPPADIITAANRSPVTLRGLAEQARGLSAPILPIPWRLIAAGLWLAEAIGLRLAFRSDSVVSIVHANTAPDFTTLENIPVVFRPFAQRAH
jgi:nucleoside-diphosphate-sugar epimerase